MTYETKDMPLTSRFMGDDIIQDITEAFSRSIDAKESTRKTYRESISQYLRWVSSTGRNLDRMNTADVLDYKRQLLDSDLSTLTVKSYIVALKRFYRWAEANGYSRDLAKNVKAPKTEKNIEEEEFLKMDLSEEQAVKLLEYYRGRSARDYAIVNLMLRTGLRTIEVSRLNEGWIREVNGRMRMQVWRKGMDRPNSRMTIGLPEKAWTPIRDYLQGRTDRDPDAPLFLTEGRGGHRNRSHKGERMSTRLIQIIVKKGLRAIGLDDHEYSAHSLRHTCAVMMLNKGASMADIQRQLGHSSQKTTMIYLKSYERRIRMEACPAEILDDSFITEEP